ncbi:MAG: HEAT repeat domain-containing protein [Gemmatimonadaceae bacterium]
MLAALNGADSLLLRRLLSNLADVPTGPQELGRDRSLWALTRARDGVLVQPLIDALGDSDWRVRAYAAWPLGVARDRRAVPALVDQLAHRVWRLRAMAAWSLHAIGDAAALPALVRMLDDEAWQVRWPVVLFVGARAAPSIATRLLAARLNDRHIAVRNAAADALAALTSRSR